MPLSEIIALRAVFSALEKALNETVSAVEYSQLSAAAQIQIDKACSMMEEVRDVMADLDLYEAMHDRKGVNTWESA